MSAWRNIKRWLKHDGLPIGVFVIAVVAIFIGLAEPAPEPLPGLAQGSMAVWRLGVAILCFIPLYLMWVALVMALGGRGFTEVGPGGAKAGSVVEETQQDAIVEQAERADRLHDELLKSNRITRAALDDVDRRLTDLERGDGKEDHSS